MPNNIQEGEGRERRRQSNKKRWGRRTKGDHGFFCCVCVQTGLTRWKKERTEFFFAAPPQVLPTSFSRIKVFRPKIPFLSFFAGT